VDEETISTQLALASEHRKAGSYAEAQRVLDALLAAAPEHALVAYHYAWLHDAQGQERATVPWYERAIRLGLRDEDLRGALLGLGSTYRALGEYARAVAVLEQGREHFSDGREFEVFLALARYNLGESRAAVALLLRTLLDTTSDPHIRAYERALRFYAAHLDETWE
jgi:tetratricopeptide (TPR) repeat protein